VLGAGKGPLPCSFLRRTGPLSRRGEAAVMAHIGTLAEDENEHAVNQRSRSLPASVQPLASVFHAERAGELGPIRQSCVSRRKTDTGSGAKRSVPELSGQGSG